MIIKGYRDLEIIRQSWQGKTCVFGAGRLGRGEAYELLRCARVRIDYYADNRISAGTEIRDGISAIDLKELYRLGDEIMVFVCVGRNYRGEILDQLLHHGIRQCTYIDGNVIAAIMESVDQADYDVQEQYHTIYDNATYLHRRFHEVTGDELNLEQPVTFNEKLQWLKLYNHDPSYTRLVDKLTFKEYVSETLGKEYVIPLLGAWDHFDEIDFTRLPDEYVLKCTHDSGSVVIVTRDNPLDKVEVRSILEERLAINYYWMGREWPYRNAGRRIIAEQYMHDDDAEELKDYKLFCFMGEVKLIQVDFDRFQVHKRNVYDTEWNYIPLEIKFPTAPEVLIPRPQCLSEMIRLAEILSKGIPHVRVDCYVVNDHPLVGEMTFFHGGGMERFTPNDWNTKFGSWIRLPQSSI